MVGNHQPHRLQQRRILQHFQRLFGVGGNGNLPARAEKNASARQGLNGVVVNEKDVGSHSQSWMLKFYVVVLVI